MSFDTAGRTMMGMTSPAMAAWWTARRIRRIAFGANCGVGASDLLRTVLGFAAQGGERPIIAKGNAGIPKYHEGHIHYDGTPELMAEYAVLARDCGGAIIGGCCGTMPEHLRHMREALETPPQAANARRSTRSSTRSAASPRPRTAPTAPAPPRAPGAGRRGRSRARFEICDDVCLRSSFELVARLGRHAERDRVRSGGSATSSPSRATATPKRRAIRSAQTPSPRHPLAPVGVVVAPAMQLPHPAHHPGRAVGKRRLQPLAEQGRDLPRQAQHDPACRDRACVPRRLKDRLELVVGQRRHDRGDHDPDRARLPRSAAGSICNRRSGAGARGSIVAGQPMVQRRDRDADPHEALARHRPKDIEVALDQRALRRDRDRMVKSRSTSSTRA